SVAFFSADWLFVAPMLAYITLLYQQQGSSGQASNVMDMLGNKITITTVTETVETMDGWLKNPQSRPRWIVATGMHGIVQAHRDPSFKKMLAAADMFVPDGISLVWLARLKGFEIKKRVSGPDVMKQFLAVANQKG